MITTKTTLISRSLLSLRNICIGIGSVSLIVIVVTFAWLVFGRYVLNVTPTWVEQVALLLICYITFLGAAAGVNDDAHLGVDFIREYLPPKLRYVVHLLADLMVAVLGGIMAVAATELVQFGRSTKLPMLAIPEGMRTLPMAICGVLMCLFSAHRLIMAIINRGYPEKDDIAQVITESND